MSIRSENTPTITNRSKKSQAPLPSENQNFRENLPDLFPTHTVTTTNPFKQLYQDSKKYEVICRSLSKENIQLNSIALSLAKSIEKMRGKLNTYRKQSILLAEENDKLKNKISYAEAQRQTAKKWVQDEYMLREEIEQQLQESERERDQLKQVVQLCKELMLEEENSGSEDQDQNSEDNTPRIYPNLKNLTMGDSNNVTNHSQRRKSKFEKRMSLAYHNQTNDDSDKMNTLVKKLDSFRMDSENDITTGPPVPASRNIYTKHRRNHRVEQLRNEEKTYDQKNLSPNYRLARSKFRDQEEENGLNAPFPSSSMIQFRPLSLVSKNTGLSPISVRPDSEIEGIDFDEMTLNGSKNEIFENLLDTLVEETEIDTETEISESEMTTLRENDEGTVETENFDNSTVYILDSSRTDAVASTIVNF